jgi:hypothetical protein
VYFSRRREAHPCSPRQTDKHENPRRSLLFRGISFPWSTSGGVCLSPVTQPSRGRRFHFRFFSTIATTKSIACVMANMVNSPIMQIRNREPVLVIGREPLVAGTIVLRNYLRSRRQYEKQLRWNALTSRFRLFKRAAVKKEYFRSPISQFECSDASASRKVSGG